MLSRRLIASVALSVSLAWSFPGRAADPPAAFECRWCDTPIKIDGIGDDEAWKHAQPIDQFYLPWLKQPRAATTKTKAKLLWDRDNLYFLAEMEDGDLFADVTEYNGQTWNNDVFELFFRPASDKPGYYEFQVNAANTRMNVFFPRRGGNFEQFKKDTAFQMQAKVALNGTLNKRTDRDKGWSVEGRIPWRDFLRTGGRPEPGEKWAFALCRYDYDVKSREPELSTCAPLKSQAHADFHHYEDYAILNFVGPDRTTSRPYGIDQLPPVVSSNVIGSPDPPPPYRMRRLFPTLKINYPICVMPQPGSDRMLVIDQPRPYGPTRIGRIHDSADDSEIETLLSLEDTAYSIVFHPKFADNGYVYIGSNGPHPSGKKRTRITRYIIDRKPPYKLDPKSATVIIDWESDGHNGGAMAFGHDGMFYVTSGDGTSDSDTNVAGQDMTKLLSKLLRIDVDHLPPPPLGKGGQGGVQYSVPKDNPFVGMKDVRPETWAFGFRNPWRMTIDEKTGRIWVGQNGQDLWEQAYLVHKGDNFGWSVTEGSHPFYTHRKVGPAPIVKPTIEHHHSEFRSLTGGVVYYGKKLPELNGAYIYGDYSTGKIWGMLHDGAKPIWHKELADSHLQITWIGVDAQGELIVADHRGDGKGAFYTFVPTPKNLPPSRFPRKLSESGLFDSVKDQRVKSGVIPYSVNSPLWSDGAYKQRWLMLPGENPKIEFTRTHGWNFPDKTVLIKSFALDTEKGRRWIETRFLTRQDGEWYGYTYKWNAAQTDAELVPAGGLDVTYRADARPWHFPSRAECMVCHSRAANFVLGPSEAQFNREHDYNGVKDNQLRVLEHLGLLKLGSEFEDWKNQVRDDAKAKGLSDKEIDKYVEKQSDTRGQRQPVGSPSLLAFSPERYNRLPDPYDKSQDLDKRARSYLHANCAHCHVEAGGGNAQMNLEFNTAKDAMKIFDVKPVHHTFGIAEARLIAPGHPERSIILKRISDRGEGHMPPLASNVVDREAVELLREWILKLKKD